MIIGFKIWYADGSKLVIGIPKVAPDAQLAVDALPTTGVQCIVVYFDEFSTVTCPNRHNQPFQPSQICVVCGTAIVGLATRYRRMVQGNDFYFAVYDTVPPPELRDWLIGQTNVADDLAKYSGAKTFTGSFVNDTAYKAFTTAAMTDMGVSEFGVTPQPGTTDS